MTFSAAVVHLVHLALLFRYASGVSEYDCVTDRIETSFILAALTVRFYPLRTIIGFIAAPTDTCVPNGQTAEFNCRTVAQISSITVDAGQEWIITTPGAGSVTYSAATINSLPVLPAVYEWIVDNSGVAVLTGLRVVSADSSLNGTIFQCNAFFSGERNASAPAATLEVAGIKLYISLVVCPLYQ